MYRHTKYLIFSACKKPINLQIHPRHTNQAVSNRWLANLSGSDSADIRMRIRIVRCQRPAKRQKHKPCETKTRSCSGNVPPLLPVGSQYRGETSPHIEHCTKPQFRWRSRIASLLSGSLRLARLQNEIAPKSLELRSEE